MATEHEVRAEITAHRRAMADVLDGLSEDQWNAASLCDGWRVREVVAHMTMPFRLTPLGFLAGMVKARGNFDRMADQSARRDTATMTTAELAASLRDNAEHPWKPPGGGWEGALFHDVIHGWDITEPLGLDVPTVPPKRRDMLLGSVNIKRSVGYFGVNLDGVQLRARDADWTLGEGAPVTGTAKDLLLVLCGRKLPPGRIDGEHAARFTEGE